MSRSPRSPRTHFIKQLSPVSSKSAAAAEAEIIRRLRREVLALTVAVDALKKNSNEWVLLNSKLEVASEELDAVLQDEQLFRSISSSGESGMLTSSSFSEERCEELLDKIPTPPLVASNVVKKLEDELSRATKYSLEWFEIKKKIDVETRKHEIISNNHLIRSVSVGSFSTRKQKRKENITKLRRLTSADWANESASRGSIKDDQIIESLKDQLERTCKYSLEWFELKRRITRKSSSGAGGKDPKAGTAQRRKIIDLPDTTQENSPEMKFTSQTNDVSYEQSHQNISEQHSPSKTQSLLYENHSKDKIVQPQSSDVMKDRGITSSTMISDSHISISENFISVSLSAPSEQHENSHHLTDNFDRSSLKESTPRTNKSDMSRNDTEQDQKTTQHMQKLHELLERVPKYSR
jgi:hypothetical protein